MTSTRKADTAEGEALIKRLRAVSIDVGFPSTTSIDSAVLRQAADELATLRARLAEVERERDEARAENERNRQGFEFHAGRAEKERERALAEAKAQGYRTAMDEASERAREIARHYKPASDGWNTFLMMAEWCDERAALDGAKP
jgi:flagellar biosynthesis/type III secretory pathway protein FliH